MSKTPDEIISELEDQFAMSAHGWQQYVDREGKPLTRKQFLPLFGNKDYCRIDKTEFPNGSYVSTVWLGINHSFGNEVPIIFESMSFENGDWNEQDRYSTEEDAKKGHQEMVARVKQRMQGRALDVDDPEDE